MIVSEEALASCEGAVFNIALNGATACHENATFDEMRHSMNNMSYITDTAGQLIIRLILLQTELVFTYYLQDFIISSSLMKMR